MAKFATAAEALAAQIAVIDARLRNIEIGTDPSLYFELSYQRAVFQQAIGVTLSGDITVEVTASALPTGASTSALQSSVQADAGSDASKAIAVQGVTGGKAVPVSLGAALPAGSNTIGAISNTSFTANAGTNLNTSALALESTLGNISGATGADGGATPSRAVLMGGKHDGIIRHVKVDNHGCLFINSDKATIGGTTSVASSATSVQLLALNKDRLFASFRNDSTAIAYIELGTTATTSSVYRLEPQGFMSLDNYTGVVSCIWASANGFMRVSEGV